MKRSLIVSAVLICLLTGSLFAGVSIPDSVAKYMEIGDKFAEKFEHLKAAFTYEKVLKYDPNNYEALWKAGDERTEFADGHENEKVKQANFEMGTAHCEKAVSVNPDGWEGHFRLSVALGRLALFRGGKEKIRLSRRVKEEAEKAITLNPEADLAYHVLGRWHQNMANLSKVLKFFAKVLYGGVPPGTNEESVEMFKKAIEVNPNHIEHHLELARTYKYMDEKELMVEPLKTVLSLKSVEEEDEYFKKEAEMMLKKLN
jgi:tetratricopeptide (TPR) repeat protein